MTKRWIAAATAAVLLVPALASAQIRQVGSSSSDRRQTIDFSVGYFALKGLDSRRDDDVLFNDIQNEQLLFQIKDLNGVPIGGDYLLGITRNIEVGVGVAFSQRTAHSVYLNLTHPDGTEIAQDLKLRTVPVSFTGRFLLLPRGSAIEPYVGAGVVAIRYDYSEVGEFVDATTLDTFTARYVSNGTATGPIVLAGVRAPIGNWVFGGELRWQNAEAKGLLVQGFTGDKLDLGGWTGNFTIGVRF
jgi:opacity protein-like surface antigen